GDSRAERAVPTARSSAEWALEARRFARGERPCSPCVDRKHNGQNPLRLQLPATMHVTILSVRNRCLAGLAAVSLAQSGCTSSDPEPNGLMSLSSRACWFKTLDHLGLRGDTPVAAPARDPTWEQLLALLRPDGLVRIALKRAYADGTVAVDMDPLSLRC